MDSMEWISDAIAGPVPMIPHSSLPVPPASSATSAIDSVLEWAIDSVLEVVEPQ
jgi:hypothetical protein